jgi:hypothetical protein
VVEVQAAADEAFGTRRLATLRRRRAKDRSSWFWPTVVLGALFVLVAVVVTVSRSQPDDRLARLANDPAFLSRAGPDESGTGCVGWPLSVTPTTKPANRFGAVTVWGDRGAFRLSNGATEPLTIDVVGEGGQVSLQHADGGGDPPADRISVRIDPGAEAAFTIKCSATGMVISGVNASGAPLGGDAYQMGTGPGPNPLKIDKIRHS